MRKRTSFTYPFAHKALAREATALVHGEEAASEAIRASEILFGGALDGITEATFREIAGEVPTHEVALDRFAGDGLWLPELLHDSQMLLHCFAKFL